MAEREDPETTRAAHWGGIAAGLMAAVIVAWWTRPELRPRNISLAFAATSGALWLMATVIAGTLGMALAGGFTWARGERRLLRVGMNAAAVWVLIPPLLLLCFEASPKLLAMVAGMAAGLAVCLWAVAPRESEHGDEIESMELGGFGVGPHFAELPPSRSGAKQSALIAVCLEVAFVLLLRDDPFWGAVWLAVGFLLLTWKVLASLTRPEKRAADPGTRLSAAALAALAVVALLVMRPAQGTAGA
ncbi:MAG: hypothetical protein WBD32_10185, partial [Acidobacteriaceae bacterium]